MLVGFVLGWLAFIAGIVLNVLFWVLQSQLNLPDAGLLFMGVGTLPLAAVIALVAWYGSRGKSRAMKGALLALASIFGVGLLLVAACFGILATMSFH